MPPLPRGTTAGRPIELADAGKGAYVVRTYPVIYPWGEPATRRGATFARDAWLRSGNYFAEPYYGRPGRRPGPDAMYLTEETAVDGEAVACDAQEQAHNDACRLIFRSRGRRTGRDDADYSAV